MTAPISISLALMIQDNDMRLVQLVLMLAMPTQFLSTSKDAYFLAKAAPLPGACSAEHASPHIIWRDSGPRQSVLTFCMHVTIIAKSDTCNHNRSSFKISKYSLANGYMTRLPQQTRWPVYNGHRITPTSQSTISSMLHYTHINFIVYYAVTCTQTTTSTLSISKTVKSSTGISSLTYVPDFSFEVWIWRRML